MKNFKSILLLISLMSVLSSCTKDDTAPDYTYNLCVEIEPLTEFAAIGKEKFMPNDSISLFAWKKDVEIVDFSNFVLNNIRFGYNGADWNTFAELVPEAAKDVYNIIVLHPQLSSNCDMKYLTSVPLNPETDLLYSKINTDNAQLPETFTLKSVFAALMISFVNGDAPAVNSFSLKMNNQAYLNALTGEVRTTDNKETVVLNKSNKINSMFCSRIVPQTLLSGTIFTVSGIKYTYEGDNVNIGPGEEIILSFNVIHGEIEDKGIVTILDKEDFDIKDFDDNGTVEGELD